MKANQQTFYYTDKGVTKDYEQAKEWAIESIASEALWECQTCGKLYSAERPADACCSKQKEDNK